VTPCVVFCLFNDAFSVTQTTQRLTKGYVNDEFKRMWKMRSWPNLKYYPSICLRRRVYLYVGSNVSEEHTASNFRVKTLVPTHNSTCRCNPKHNRWPFHSFDNLNSQYSITAFHSRCTTDYVVKETANTYYSSLLHAVLSNISGLYLYSIVSRVAQPEQCLATGWKTGRSRFDLRQRRKDFSSSLCV
jgi:hypothetical protein